MICVILWFLFVRRVAWIFVFNWVALLSGTLKTYQRAACDEETMTLKCPPGTTILVEHAQYGRTGMQGISKCNSSVAPMIAGDEPMNHTCIWPQSVQVCANEILPFPAGGCRLSENAQAFQAYRKLLPHCKRINRFNWLAREMKKETENKIWRRLCIKIFFQVYI